MARCEQCQRDTHQRFAVTIYDESQDFREWSAIDTLYAYYTGDITIHICILCFNLLTGSPPLEFKPPKNLFNIRRIQSAIATEIAKGLFEDCGYEVRHSGYEYSMPEWVKSLKTGDPNPIALQVRAMPDLRVYDRELNTLYEVEIKTTRLNSSRWRYRKDQIDTIRYYHPEAILMVYVQPEHEFYVQNIKRVDWDRITTSIYKSRSYYELDLRTVFRKPTDLFERITIDIYYPFLEGVKEILTSFV